jgi:hypothetical protein
MSSIESMISEIEEDYDEIIKEFEAYVDMGVEYYHFKEITGGKVLELTRNVMRFQRKIEYFLEQIRRLSTNVEFTKRISSITDSVLRVLSSNEEIDSVRISYTTYDFSGVVTELREARSQLLRGNTDSCRIRCYCAYFSLKLLRPSLIEMEEEMRLIGALSTYPIEKKLKLKHQLVIGDFEEVAVSLDEAETNVESQHFKDCVSRCRDAVEIFVAFVREEKTGEKTERHFSSDLGKLMKLEVFDQGTDRLAQGVYSFLSLKGSHKYDAAKVTVYDAETALKETYSLLEMLLKKYRDRKKDKV